MGVALSSRRVASSRIERAVVKALESVDVHVGGTRPWDVTITEPKVFSAIARGDLSLVCEGFVRGWWDCERVDELVARLLTGRLESSLPRGLLGFVAFVKTVVTDGGSRIGARRVAQTHYDLGNELFEVMLDSNMAYSCGYWSEALNLEDAQTAKLDLICRKIGLQPGMQVLDIGGGWGSFAAFAARKYGVSVVNITVSQEQKELADRRCVGLQVENRLQDYRDVQGSFDRVVSVGMFEHVGPKNYRAYFQKVRSLIGPKGVFLLHTIGASTRGHATNPWIDQFIFPGGYIPAVVQLAEALEDLFVIEDWHNFGADYDRTLMAWYTNFEANWEQIQDRFQPDFFRRWKLYLQGCAGSFRAREMQLWQIGPFRKWDRRRLSVHSVAQAQGELENDN